MSDIFVALPPSTKSSGVIFGKNSDRPPSEVQDVVYVASSDNDANSEIQCTHIKIPQVSHTNAVILSKPSWTWGAEMGANEFGVCVGNTSTWNKTCKEEGNQTNKLHGVDLVRLALERGNSAEEALNVITKLLEEFGQCGSCCDDEKFAKWSYNNSFLIADKKEAWLVDTVGEVWVAKHITSGVHNISSALSIGTEYDRSAEKLKEFAQSSGLWSPDAGDLDFSSTFGAPFPGVSLSDAQQPEQRLAKGRQLMETHSQEGTFTLESMLEILRHEDSQINFHGDLLTTGSQISVLSPTDSRIPDCHWFTATPDPSKSVFKPFIFTSDVDIGGATESRETTSSDGQHLLYRSHKKALEYMADKTTRGVKLQVIIPELEKQCMADVNEFLSTFDQANLSEVSDLFADVVDAEVKFYVK